MKITDLLERQIETQIEPDAKYSKRLRRGTPKYKQNSEYGNSARVSPSKTDPHMVVKNDKNPNEQADNYNRYIQELIKLDLIDTNPHFPRVYNIKKITDKYNKFIYKYVMEKLVKWEALSVEEMETMADTVIIEPLPADFNNWGEGKRWSYCYNEIMVVLEKEANDYDNLIKQKTLKYAIAQIKQIGTHIRVRPNDIGGDNIMFRRTPFGLQLVITDPFYN